MATHVHRLRDDGTCAREPAFRTSRGDHRHRYSGWRAPRAKLQDARRAAPDGGPQTHRDGEHAGVRPLRRHEHGRPTRHRPHADDEFRTAVPRATAEPPLPAAGEPAAARAHGRDPFGHVHRTRPRVQRLELDHAVRGQAHQRRGRFDLGHASVRGDQAAEDGCRSSGTR